ncbi:hypothetical protein [Burkholderia mayonis]|uniref:hypothetical protein n=1 Tax=Burkholderia mayonis TaxID=1385591 RepID=UPI00131F045D|nr:hypothetical protein [Burkholderia mayonis]
MTRFPVERLRRGNAAQAAALRGAPASPRRNGGRDRSEPMRAPRRHDAAPAQHDRPPPASIRRLLDDRQKLCKRGF